MVVPPYLILESKLIESPVADGQGWSWSQCKRMPKIREAEKFVGYAYEKEKWEKYYSYNSTCNCEVIHLWFFLKQPYFSARGSKTSYVPTTQDNVKMLKLCYTTRGCLTVFAAVRCMNTRIPTKMKQFSYEFFSSANSIWGRLYDETQFKFQHGQDFQWFKKLLIISLCNRPQKFL